jgi:DNA-binding winged helix-turn-helix (wHTH) protein
MTHAPTFAFGPFLFIPRRQLLLRRGEAVRVGCRALDLLAALVQRPGEPVTKRELIDQAWPSTTVGEGNLKVHIAALRRALDDDADDVRYIATVNGRGYRFIAPVEAGEASTALAVPPIDPQLQAVDLHAPSETELEAVVALLARATRSLIVDLPVGAGGDARDAPSRSRRVLFIELNGWDESWIEVLLARRLRVISATP